MLSNLSEVIVPTGGAESFTKKILTAQVLIPAGICLVIAIFLTRWINGIFSWLASIPRLLLMILVLVVGSFFGFITINLVALKK